MKKKVKPIMHFYFPEAKQQGKKVKIDERFYIDYVLRNSITNSGYALHHYGNIAEGNFVKQLKNKKNEKDLFYIIFDSDFESSNNYAQAAQGIKNNTRDYIRLARSNNKKLKILLSSRAFETFLCMYERTNGYTCPYYCMEDLMNDVLINKSDDKYNKSEDWYLNNSDNMIIDDISIMINKIKKSRLQVFTNNSSPIKNYDNPNYFSDIEVAFLAKTAPYTYFDFLLEDLL